MIKLVVSNLKIYFKKELQYKAATISGAITQIFFGFMYIMIFMAFYKSNGEPTNFTLIQMSSYIWLQQSFYVMFRFFDGDRDLSKKIINGDVSYQMLKPISLYNQWFISYYTSSIAKASLRAIPMFLIFLLLPFDIGLSLPVSLNAFLMFLLTFFLGTILVVAVNLFSYILVSIFHSRGAVFGIVNIIASLLSGALVPLALLPDSFIRIISYFPFRYIFDIPYRLYVGNISVNGSYIYVLIQIFWIILAITLGKLWLNKRSKKLIIQGG